MLREVLPCCHLQRSATQRLHDSIQIRSSKQIPVHTGDAGDSDRHTPFNMDATASVQELQTKLSEHKAQLLQVERLLKLQAKDDILTKLRDDLISVIKLTEELTATRIIKTKPVEKEQHAGSISQVGDRVSAKFTDGKWYNAKIETVLSRETKYVVKFLDYGDTTSVPFDSVRPFVPLRPEELSVGQSIRAIFPGDGLYYDATISASLPGNRYSITFAQYGDADEVHINDIDLPIKAKKRTMTSESHAELEIPEYLRIKETDSEEQKESKRRRIRSMKSNHRQLVKENDLNSRANSWQAFSKSAVGANPSKKAKISAPLPGFRQGPSIFAAPAGAGRVGVTNSGRGLTHAVASNAASMRGFVPAEQQNDD